MNFYLLCHCSMHVMAPSTMSSSYAHRQHPVRWTGQPHQNTAAPAAVHNSLHQNTAAPAAAHNSRHQQDPAMRVSTAPPAHCGRGDHPLFSTPLRGVSNPTCHQQDPAMRVSTAPPAHCGRGGTTFSSPPHSVGCLTNHGGSGRRPTSPHQNTAAPAAVLSCPSSTFRPAGRDTHRLGA